MDLCHIGTTSVLTVSHSWAAVARARPLLLAALCVLAFGCDAEPNDSEGVDVGSIGQVHDGDTLTVLIAGRESRVRIAKIDAPEFGQPYGDDARNALASLVRGRKVRLEIEDTDQYGRLIARIYVADSNVGEEMVRQGYAWAFRRFNPGQRLRDLEREARAAKVGLWAQANPTPPWQWRDAQREPERACQIKGNINDRGVKIYHLPGSEHYGETRISTASGERWFCTEQEARAAGWRAARNR